MRGKYLSALGLSLLAGLLAFKIWRAHLETSIWIDEIASLVLASRPVAAIADVSAIDTNPPGYFLLLKAWLKLARGLGFEPGILWARLLGTLAWLGLVLIAWRGGRRLLGPLEAAVLAAAVAGSSYAGVLANDARGYSIASVALFACFLLLLRSYQEEGRASPAWRPSILRWLLYVICALAALWTHVLSLLVLACLALLWFGLVVRAHAWRSRFAGLGAGAHALAFLLFLPWLLNLRGQVASLQTSAPTWMTPATWFNFGSVFWYWYPFGRVGEPTRPPLPLFPVLGVLSILIPVLLAIGTFKVPDAGGHRRTLGLVAFSGLGVSLLFVILLWTMQRSGVASIFHAPRYPALTAALWASGLAGLAGLAGARRRLRGLCIGGAIAPWLACAVLGQGIVPSVETRGGLRAELSQLAGIPSPGTPVYVMPSELIPFYRGSLSEYRVRRIEDLPCGLAGAEEAWVLNLNPWRLFDRARDLIAQKLLAGEALADTAQRFSFPQALPLYELYHLRSIRRDAAALLCSQGLQPAERPVPPNAVAAAFPEEQRYTDGWSYPEVTAERGIYRWAAAPAVAVRFDRSLPPGDYILHFKGYRAAQPQDVVDMVFSFGGTSRTVKQPEGEISLEMTVHLEDGVRHPRLIVQHPTWKPAPSGSADTRTLASAFQLAWIEKQRADLTGS